MEVLVKEISKNGAQEKGISARVETISPHMAKMLLENQFSDGKLRQRPLSITTAERFARDMSCGNWKLNGESIIIGKSGRLLDGQHRLHAVVLVDQAIQFMVVRGVDDSAFTSMGQSKNRSVADVLFIRGKKYHKHLASIIRMYYAWDSFRKMNHLGGRNSPSTETLLKLLEKHPGLEHASRYVGRKFSVARFIPINVFGSLFYIFEGIDPELRNVFFSKLVDGIGLEKDDPVRMVRDRLISMRETELRERSRVDPEQKAALIIKAWNYVREGKTVKRVSYRHTDGFPYPI